MTVQLQCGSQLRTLVESCASHAWSEAMPDAELADDVPQNVPEARCIHLAWQSLVHSSCKLLRA